MAARRWLRLLGLALLPAFAACAGQAVSVADGSADTAPVMFGVSPARNLVNTTDHGIPAEWSTQEGARKNIKWVAPLSTKAYGGPIVAGGRVYVGIDNRNPHNPAVTGDKGILLCLREPDGKPLWQAAHDPLPEEIAKEARVEGLASTPAVEAGRVYYVSNRGELTCADAQGAGARADGAPADAKFLWQLDMVKDLNVFPHKLPNGSPLLIGDALYVTTGNGSDGEGMEAKPPHPEAPSLIAVDKRSGKVLWQDNSPGENIMLGQWSNPAYAVVNGKPQVVFGGGDGWLRGFDGASGKPIWKFDCNPKSAASKGRAGRNYILATPVVYENRVYVGVGQEPSQGPGIGHLWCVALDKTGDVSPVGDNFDPKAPANKNSALVWHFGGPGDPQGERDAVFGRTLSTCAIHDGLLYAAELSGYLYCLDARTGQKYWDHDLKAEVWGSPYWVDGKVYIGTTDGDVHVFAHGKEKKVLAKVEMGEPIHSTPSAANGVLYVMTAQNLYAIRAEK